MSRSQEGPSERDLLVIVGDLYDAALDREKLPSALQSLIETVGGVGGSVMELHSNAFEPKRIAGTALRDYFADYTANRYWQIEPRVQRLRAGRDSPSSAWGALARGKIVTDLDFMSAQECDVHPYYQEFLRCHDLRYGAYFWIDLPDRRLVFAALRSVAGGSFTSANLNRLSLLRRHLVTSLRMSSALSTSAEVRDGLVEMLSSLGMAALLLDDSKRIVYANQAAGQLDGVAISLRGSRLAAMSPSDQAGVDRLVGVALRGGTNARLEPIKLNRTDSGGALVMQAMPLSAAALEANSLLGPVGAIVVISDPHTKSLGNPETALRALGLTRAEARIAYWSGQGLSAAAVGDKVGNTVGTVRFTLKRVFDKLGVSRQSELALLVARVADLGMVANRTVDMR